MKEFLKNILDRLPLNGKKTILGFLIAYLSAKFSLPNELILEIIKQLGLNAQVNLELAGLGLATIGILHKKVK